MSVYRAIRRFLAAVLGLIALLAVLLWLAAPRPIFADALGAHESDIANGERLFAVAGCASCHAGVENENVPRGGKPFPTPIGTFYPPNLTPHESGLKGWREIDFVNAVLRGITPGVTHYFPAFPYAAYQAMRLGDARDIFAYLKTLPPVKADTRPGGVIFGYALRPFVGLWKRLAMDYQTFTPDPAQGESWNRGAYLVNAVGRCGECHTPRNLFFISERSRAMKGGPHPAEEGTVPDITASGNLGDWSHGDVVSVLETGFKPDFSDDISSGGMDDVIKGLKSLPKDDLAAIATYLKSLE